MIKLFLNAFALAAGVVGLAACSPGTNDRAAGQALMEAVEECDQAKAEDALRKLGDGDVDRDAITDELYIWDRFGRLYAKGQRCVILAATLARHGVLNPDYVPFADFDNIDYNTDTVFHIALRQSSHSLAFSHLAVSLLEAGADPNVKTGTGFDIEETSLEIAINNHTGLVMPLLVHGAKPESQDLLSAVELGDVEIVAALLEAGAPRDGLGRMINNAILNEDSDVPRLVASGGGTVRDASFSPSGYQFALLEESGALSLWDTDSERMIWRAQASTESEYYDYIYFNQEGDNLITRVGESLAFWRIHDGSPAGQTYLDGPSSLDSFVHKPVPDRLSQLPLSSNGWADPVMDTAELAGQIFIEDLVLDRNEIRKNKALAGAVDISSLHASDDGRFVFALSAKGAQLWDTQADSIVKIVPRTNPEARVLDIGLAKSGNTLYLLDTEGDADIWRRHASTDEGGWGFHGTIRLEGSMALSRHGRMLAACQDGEALVADLDSDMQSSSHAGYSTTSSYGRVLGEQLADRACARAAAAGISWPVTDTSALKKGVLRWGDLSHGDYELRYDSTIFTHWNDAEDELAGIRAYSGHTLGIEGARFLSDDLLVSVDAMWLILWDRSTSEWVAKFRKLQDGNWLVISPDGRFDTGGLDDTPGLSWVTSDHPLKPLPVDAYMETYYEPGLLKLVLGQFSPGS